MATATLSFFTTPTPTTRATTRRSTIWKQPLSFVCKNNPPISSNTFRGFQSLPKSSVAESPVIDVEPTQSDVADLETPKREQVFAVVMIGSRQYIVFPGRYLTTQRLKGANVDDKIILNKVLLVGTKTGTETSTYIGEPVVTNAVVHAVVEDVGLNPKVVVYKYKKRKNYRRNIGHRQPNTRIRITGITGYQDFPAVTMDSLKQAA